MKSRNYRALKQQVIQALRKDKSKSWLSIRMGYEYNQVSRWESGERKFKWSDFIHMCKTLNVRLSDASKALFTSIDLEVCSSADTVSALIGKRSLVEVAEAMELSTDKLSRWVNGKSEPTFEEALQLIDLYRASIIDFLSYIVDVDKLSGLIEYSKSDKELHIVAEHPILSWLGFLPWLTRFEGKGIKSFEELAKLVHIDREILKEAFDESIKAGFLFFNDKGELEANQNYVSLNLLDDDEVNDFRSFWIDQAYQRLRIHKDLSDERKNDNIFSVSIIAMSEENWKKAIELRNQFILDIGNLASESDKEDVAKVVNLQMFDLLKE